MGGNGKKNILLLYCFLKCYTFYTTLPLSLDFCEMQKKKRRGRVGDKDNRCDIKWKW
jgi:hypothetical protein